VATQYLAGYEAGSAALGFRGGEFGAEGWARRDIVAGGTLGLLPYDNILTEGYAAGTPTGAAALAALVAVVPPILTPGRLALYCVMAVERASESPSPSSRPLPWHPRFARYLTSLPPTYDDPLWWDDIALAVVAGTDVGAAVDDRRAWLQRALGILSAAAASAPADHAGWAPLRHVLTWKTLRWAHSTHASRAFPASLGVPPGAPVDEAAVGCLLPGLDLLNHRYRTRITWERRQDGVAFVTADGVPAGAQVFNNYGAKSNDEFLVGYGFVLPRNVHDAAAVKVGVGGATGVMFAALRDALQLLSRVSWSWASDGGIAVPAELVTTMRLATWCAWQAAAGAGAVPEADAVRALVTAPLSPPAAERYVALQLAALFARRVAAHDMPLPSASSAVDAHMRLACAYRRGQAHLLAAMFAATLRPLTCLTATSAPRPPPPSCTLTTVNPLPLPHALGCGEYMLMSSLPAGGIVATFDAACPALCPGWADPSGLWPAVCSVCDDAGDEDDEDDGEAPPRMRAAFALACWIVGEAAAGSMPTARAAVEWAEANYNDGAVADFVTAAAVPAAKRARVDSSGDTAGDDDGDDDDDVGGDVEANTEYWVTAWKAAAPRLRKAHAAAWTRQAASRSRVVATCHAVYAAATWVVVDDAAAPMRLALLPLFPRLPPPATALMVATARHAAVVPCTVAVHGQVMTLCALAAGATGDALALDVGASPVWAALDGTGAAAVCDAAAAGVFGPTDDAPVAEYAAAQAVARRIIATAACDAVAEVTSALADGRPALPPAASFCLPPSS